MTGVRVGGDHGGAATDQGEPKLRRWIDRRPLALSVAVGLVALLLGATRAERSPPLFAAGLLGNRDALVSVPPDEVEGAAYLEASSPRNRDLYKRHGFEVVDVVELAADGPVHWLMWREPRR